jgi:hypothetical protein
MRFGQLCGIALIGLGMAGCATQIDNEAARVIRAGAPNIDVASYPLRAYDRADGSHCEDYRIYESGSGVARQGVATVCRYTGQRWILIARAFEAVGSSTPVYSTPVPTTSVPVTQNPPPPSSGTTVPGQWAPVTQ